MKMQGEDKAWLDYRERFSEVYDESNYSSPLQKLAMRASHRLVENAYAEQDFFSKVVEVGAGTGGHLPFIRHRFNEYVLTDVDPKTLDVAKRKFAAGYDNRVKFETQTGDHLAYADSTVDRLIAVHVLEHIHQPHLALKEWFRVLRHGGVLSILIPTDPGLAWRLGRCLGPRKNAIKQGIAYDYVMAREHVNSCNNLIAILRHYFQKAEEAWWPTRIPSIDINLFFAFHTVVDKEE